MKKGLVLNFKHLKLLNYVTFNKVYIAICFLFLLGISLGSTVLFKNDFLLDKIKTLFDNFIKLHTDYVFIKKFFVVFIRCFFLLVLYFLSGTSMLGVAVTPFITVWQGMIIGGVMSHLYSSYGFIGVAFNAIVLIPPTVFFVLCCFFAAKYSIDFSLSIARLTLPKSRPVSLYIDFKKYCFKYLIFISFSLLCTLIEITLNVLFLKFFKF